MPERLIRPIEPGRWYCVEAMLKANSSPEKSDGVQAFWVDGELYGRFDGFRWRTTDKLKINSFWLLFYNTDQPARHNKDPRPESRVMEVWFDDVVVATEYVGPVQGRPSGGKKKATPSRSALLTPGLIIAEPSNTVFTERFDTSAADQQRPRDRLVPIQPGSDTGCQAFGPAKPASACRGS